MAKEPHHKASSKEIEDDKEYAVTLNKPVTYKGITYNPDHNPRMRGSFLKLIQSLPENEGAVDGHSEVTS
jgi:hypothetical protein